MYEVTMFYILQKNDICSLVILLTSSVLGKMSRLQIYLGYQKLLGYMLLSRYKYWLEISLGVLLRSPIFYI